MSTSLDTHFFEETTETSLHSFLFSSYNHAKKQIGSGVTRFKDEVSGMYDQAGYFLQQMALPVNNFLKDFNEIDTELSQEINKDTAAFMSLNGKIVPVDQVLSLPMEENY